MNDIVIELTERVRIDYRALPRPIQDKFKKQLRFLADDPRHPSLHIHRIRGSSDYWDSISMILIGVSFVAKGMSTI